MIFGISCGPLITPVRLKNSKNHKHSKTFHELEIAALLRVLWTKICFYNFYYFLWFFDHPNELKK